MQNNISGNIHGVIGREGIDGGVRLRSRDSKDRENEADYSDKQETIHNPLSVGDSGTHLNIQIIFSI